MVGTASILLVIETVRLKVINTVKANLRSLTGILDQLLLPSLAGPEASIGQLRQPGHLWLRPGDHHLTRSAVVVVDNVLVHGIRVREEEGGQELDPFKGLTKKAVESEPEFSIV
jgi:hypothetical protein